ncbi:MAG: hypothetical protein JNL08_03875 [Planctomycetes bacterium]|nr:hypothetical protein [Planctomycetota bacterium]
MRPFLVLLIAAVMVAVWWRSEAAFGATAAPPAAPPARVDEAAVPAVPLAAAPASPASPAAPAAAPALVRFVVLAADGAPIAGAHVQVTAGAEPPVAAATDARGHALLPRSAAAATFRVRAVGHWPAVGAVAAEAECRVVLALAPRLHGRVFDAEARPLRGARVLLLAALAGRRMAPPELPPDAVPVLSDGDGGFVLPWPAPGPHDLVVDAEGHAPHVTAALDGAVHGGGEQRVQLQRAAVVRGRALAADGSALASARIEIRARSAAPRAAPRFGPPMDWVAEDLLATVQADAAGAFVVDGLPVGAAVVALAAVHGAAGRDVTLLAGVTVAVELQAPPAASLHGRIVGPGVAAVLLHAGAVPLRTVVPAGDGTFAFDAVPPGRCLVAALPAAALGDLTAAVAALQDGRAPWPAVAVLLQPGERREVALAAH